jgi:putative ABC transport system permease protein
MILDHFTKDVAYAVRSLARSRGFTIAAVLTLAVGIGAATAIYSVVDTILLRPLPFPDSDRLVRLVENYAIPNRQQMFQRGLTHQEFLDWRAKTRTLVDATALVGMSQRMVKTPDGAAGLWGAMAAANVFELLQVKAMLGRVLGPGDEASPDVVVLSNDTWQRYYHSDPAIVGKALEFRTGALLAPIPARLLTVMGVLPADFESPTGPLDFYTPIALDPSKRSPQVTMIARLAPGVSVQAATDEATTMGNAIRPPWPTDVMPLTGPRFEIQSLKERTVATLRPALRLLLAAVVVVLMIVCANVANLLLARGTVMQRDVAVRLAIGASRADILRQVLIESLVLAVGGGVLGALLGAAGVSMVKQLATVDAPGVFRLMFGSTILPRAGEVGVNFRVFAIAFTIAAITSVVFGILPALRLSRTNHLQAMGSRGGGAARGEARLRGALVMGQLVLATVLLVGAGLLVNSFMRLSTFDKGYDPSNVLAINLLFPDQYSTARKAETIETLLTRFRASPNVRAAGFARHGLLIGEELTIGNFVPPGKTLEEMTTERFRVRAVSDGFLTAMGVPLLEGRDLSPADSAMAQPVVAMNRSAAQRLFGATSAAGQVVDWHVGKNQAQMTVAGVFADVRQESATDVLVPEIFVDYRQWLHLQELWGDPPQRQNEWVIGFLSFALRTAGDPSAAVPAVREVVRVVDPNIGIDAIVPMVRLEASSFARERFYAVVLGVFAGVAGLLAAIGIYGVLSYAVVQRTNEIGVRMALGAQRGQVLGLMMRQGLLLAAAGVLLGLICAAVGARSLQSLLFGVAPLDAATFGAVAAAFALVAAAASYLPARRATKVDPVVALRAE